MRKLLNILVDEDGQCDFYFRDSRNQREPFTVREFEEGSKSRALLEQIQSAVMDLWMSGEK